MKAGSIDLDLLNDPKYKDLVNKIGYDEKGRDWKKMKPKDKIDVVLEILQDPLELDERLAGTIFNFFLATLSDFVGGDARQRDILAKKIDVELEGVTSQYVPNKVTSEAIYEVFKRCKSIGRTDIDGLKEKFWDVYRDIENVSFRKLKKEVNARFMVRPFTELEKYYELASMLEWTVECEKAIDAIKKLVRRHLSLVLSYLETWKFGSYCRSAGGVEQPTSSPLRCASCDSNKQSYITNTTNHSYDAYNPSTSYIYPNCYRVRNLNKAYFICGERGQFLVNRNWRSCETLTWQNLSPQDWIIILDSLSLVWNQIRFIRDFGPEKVKLNAALMKFHGTFSSISGINLDSCIVKEGMDRISLHAYKEQITKSGYLSPIFKSRLEMPDSLDNSSHWGFLAWKYIDFFSARQVCGGKKRKASSLSDDNTSGDVSNKLIV